MIDPIFVIAASCITGICVVAFALLRAWQQWLDFKRQELERARHSRRGADPDETAHGSTGAARIELADLRERIKKLEAIASGVEL
jgi:hypothetical protein